MSQQSRLRLLLAATLISTALAQTIVPSQIAAPNTQQSNAPSYPPCAEVCLAAATAELPCAENDSSCLCSHSDQVRSSVEQCLEASGACPAAETKYAASYYEDVCEQLGLDSNGEPFLLTTAPPISATRLAPSPTLSILPTTAAISTTTPTSTAAKEDSESSDDDGGLGVAQVAGIAGGVAFIVVALITGIIWIYIKRRDEADDHHGDSESQSKINKSGYDTGSSKSMTSVGKSEKDIEFALTSLPTKPTPNRRSERPLPNPHQPKRKPTIAERRQREPRHLQQSPSETLNTSTYPFPFGDKFNAEASVTSLSIPTSAKPVSAMIVQNSPARSQFSDVASICSMSSYQSDQPDIRHASTARMSRPTTFYNMYAGDGGLSPEPPRGNAAREKPELRITAPNTPLSPPVDSPNPFTVSPQAASRNPFSTPEAVDKKNPFSDDGAISPLSAQERYHAYGPDSTSRQADVSRPGSFGRFQFELTSDNKHQTSSSFGDDFFNTLDSRHRGQGASR